MATAIKAQNGYAILCFGIKVVRRLNSSPMTDAKKK
jgi:hypothetical protein